MLHQPGQAVVDPALHGQAITADLLPEGSQAGVGVATGGAGGRAGRQPVAGIVGGGIRSRRCRWRLCSRVGRGGVGWGGAAAQGRPGAGCWWRGCLVGYLVLAGQGSGVRPGCRLQAAGAMGWPCPRETAGSARRAAFGLGAARGRVAVQNFISVVRLTTPRKRPSSATTGSGQGALPMGLYSPPPGCRRQAGDVRQEGVAQPQRPMVAVQGVAQRLRADDPRYCLRLVST